MDDVVIKDDDIFEVLNLRKIKIFNHSDIYFYKEIGSVQENKNAGYLNNILIYYCDVSNAQPKQIIHSLSVLHSIRNCGNVQKLKGVARDSRNRIVGFIFKYIDGYLLDEIINYLKEEQKIKILKSIVRSLSSLHKLDFVHRNINHQHIIIDKQGKVYIIGFGISKVHIESAFTIAKGNVYYLAPEVYNEEIQYTNDKGELVHTADNKLDIWALGCLISYLFSGVIPWCDKYKTEFKISKALIKKEVFPIPQSITCESVKKLITFCTNPDKNTRPSIHDIEVLLQSFW